MARLFDPKKDYQALINAEKTKGSLANQNLINQYNKQRAAKIYSNPELTAKYEDTIPEQYKTKVGIPTLSGGSAPPPAVPTLTQPGTTPPPAVPTASLQAPTTTTPKPVTTTTPTISTAGAAPTQPTVSSAPTQQSAYQSRYDQDLASGLKALQDIINNKPAYDPGTDQGLIAAQNQAIQAVNRGMSRRNMLSGTTGEAKRLLTAGALTPQYQALQEQAYQNAVQNRINALQQTNLLDQASYQQYSGQRELGQGDVRLAQSDRELGQGDIKLQQSARELDQGDIRLQQSGAQIGLQEAQQQGQLTGQYNTPEQLTVLKGGIANVPQNVVDKVMSFAGQDGGIQAYINTLDKNSIDYTQAQLVRNQYLQDNPQLAARYGTSAATNIGQQTVPQGTLNLQQRQQQAVETEAHSKSTGQYLTPDQMTAMQQPIPDPVRNRVMSFVGKDGGIQGYINTLDPNSTEYVQAVMLRNQYIAENKLPQEQTQLGQKTIESQQVEDTTAINKANLVGFLDTNKNNKIDDNELKTLSAQELDQRVTEFAQTMGLNKAELMGFLDQNGNNRIDPGEETLAKQQLNEQVTQFNQELGMEQQKLNLSKEQFEKEYGVKLADLMGGFDFNNNGVIEPNEYTQRAKEFEQQLGLQEGAMTGSYAPSTEAANPANQRSIPTLDSQKVMNTFVEDVPYKENTAYKQTYTYINDIARKAKAGSVMKDQKKIDNFKIVYDELNGQGAFDEKYMSKYGIKFVDYTTAMVKYLTQPDKAMEYIQAFGKDGITGYKDILKSLNVKKSTQDSLFDQLKI